MDDRNRWWEVKEQPFCSGLPLFGPVVVWLRRTWNNIATRWYVLPILEQQNKVNATLVEAVSGLREELSAVQAILVDLDREAQISRRDLTSALYRMNAEIERLGDKLDALDAQVSPIKKGNSR